jgi:hypothetical protein
VAQKGMALRYASRALQADADVVAAAVNQFGSALQFASGELKRSAAVVAAAAQRNGVDALFYAHPSLRDDRSVVLAAVRQSGGALQLASPRLQADVDVVAAAVAQWPRALQFASPSLQDDPRVFAAAAAATAAAAAATEAAAAALGAAAATNGAAAETGTVGAREEVHKPKTSAFAAFAAKLNTAAAPSAAAPTDSQPKPAHWSDDWVCSKCRFVNFARRGACRRCSQLAPCVAGAASEAAEASAVAGAVGPPVALAASALPRGVGSADGERDECDRQGSYWRARKDEDKERRRALAPWQSKRRPMNAPQRAVVAAAMARRLTLIQGPPGTGKTIVVARVVQAAVYLKKQVGWVGGWVGWVGGWVGG